jgi:hypothetical protein
MKRTRRSNTEDEEIFVNKLRKIEKILCGTEPNEERKIVITEVTSYFEARQEDLTRFFEENRWTIRKVNRIYQNRVTQRKKATIDEKESKGNFSEQHSHVI